MPGVLLILALLILLALSCARPLGDRWWAWRAARRFAHTNPLGPWHIRALVFVLGTTRRSFTFVGVRAEVSTEELASIRRWAKAAPGERRWTTYRRERTFRRLRVAGSPAAG